MNDHVLAIFSLVIAIVGIPLSFVISVSANLYSPRIRDWSSTKNQERLGKRINELQARLEKSESSWTYTASEWELWRVIYWVARTICIGFLFTLGAILTGFSDWLYYHQNFNFHALRIFWGVAFFAVLGYVVMMDAFLFAGRRLSQQQDMHTEIGRDGLRTRIEKLKAQEKPAQPSATAPFSIYVNGKLISSVNLRVLSAKYGCANKSVDVTWLVAGRVKDARLNIPVNNELVTQDPCPGIVKALTVEYEYDDKRFTKTVAENDVLSIP